jgi:hypothetical protein
MGRTCSTHEREVKCGQGFGGRTRKKSHKEDLDMDGRIILR